MMLLNGQPLLGEGEGEGEGKGQARLGQPCLALVRVHYVMAYQILLPSFGEVWFGKFVLCLLQLASLALVGQVVLVWIELQFQIQ